MRFEMFKRFRSAFLMLFRRDRFESDLELELRDHIERFTEELVARGVPREEAVRRARVEFGGIEAIKESCRENTALAWIHAFGRDLRYGFRLLRRSPVFAVVAIATLGLCIGANTAIFSIVDAVLFRPAPYPDSDRLGQVVAELRTADDEGLRDSVDGRTWEAIRDHAESVDAAVLSNWTTGVNFLGGDRADFVQQQRVGTGFFRVLGVTPRLGREFLPEEDLPEGPAVTILSYQLWAEVYEKDLGIVGEEIMLRGEPHVVVGVMPDGFRSTVNADLWTPLRPSTRGEGGGENYQVIARLREGESWIRANTELATIGNELFASEQQSGSSITLALQPINRVMGYGLRTPLLILWGAVGIVLLIGCVNLTGLLLARSTTRRHEIATRMAIGGGRVPIVRQLLAEALALALCGGVAGLAIGWFTIRMLRMVAVSTLDVVQEIGLDPRVLGVTVLIICSTSLVFGLVPAWTLSRTKLGAVLADSGIRVASGRLRHWPRRLLVTGEVALGVVLVVSATLLVRSFGYLRGIEPGFDPNGLITATVSLQDARYETSAKMTRLFEQSLERIRTTPGIESATVTLTLPYERPLNLPFRSQELGYGQENPGLMNLVYVMPGFFEVLDVPVRLGRSIQTTDTAESPLVGVVNDAFVERYMNDRLPLGVKLNDQIEIVGVVGNIVQRDSWGEFEPVAKIPTLYVAAAQMEDATIVLVHTWFSPSWIVRTSGSPESGIAAIREGIQGVDPTLPVATIRTIDDVANETLALQRFQAILMGAMAVLALLLAAVGLAGLIASMVSERKREIGIRMALGSTRLRAIGSMARPGITLGVIGLVIGGLTTPAAIKVLRSFIWGISATDPATIGFVVVILLGVTVIASVAPALRIARLDPAATLREE